MTRTTSKREVGYASDCVPEATTQRRRPSKAPPYLCSSFHFISFPHIRHMKHSRLRCCSSAMHSFHSPQRRACDHLAYVRRASPARRSSPYEGGISILPSDPTGLSISQGSAPKNALLGVIMHSASNDWTLTCLVQPRRQIPEASIQSPTQM